MVIIFSEEFVRVAEFDIPTVAKAFADHFIEFETAATGDPTMIPNPFSV